MPYYTSLGQLRKFWEPLAVGGEQEKEEEEEEEEAI